MGAHNLCRTKSPGYSEDKVLCTHGLVRHGGFLATQGWTLAFTLNLRSKSLAGEQPPIAGGRTPCSLAGVPNLWAVGHLISRRSPPSLWGLFYRFSQHERCWLRKGHSRNVKLLAFLQRALRRPTQPFDRTIIHLPLEQIIRSRITLTACPARL